MAQSELYLRPACRSRTRRRLREEADVFPLVQALGEFLLDVRFMNDMLADRMVHLKRREISYFEDGTIAVRQVFFSRVNRRRDTADEPNDHTDSCDLDLPSS